jgi:anti-anti-sigma factor
MLKVHSIESGTVAVLCLEGQIVTGETEALRRAVQNLSEVSAVKLDFARVTTVDAAGLGVMLELRQQVETKGRRFELMNVGRQICQVLAVTRLDTVFRITNRVEFSPADVRRLRAPLASCA